MTWTSFFEQMYTCKSILAGIEIHTAFKASDNSSCIFFFYSLHWIKVLKQFQTRPTSASACAVVFIQRSASPSTNETQSPWPFHFLTMNNSPGPCLLSHIVSHTHTKEIVNKDSLCNHPHVLSFFTKHSSLVHLFVSKLFELHKDQGYYS